MPSSSDKTPRTAASVLISSEAHLAQQMEPFQNPIGYLTSRAHGKRLEREAQNLQGNWANYLPRSGRPTRFVPVQHEMYLTG